MIRARRTLLLTFAACALASCSDGRSDGPIWAKDEASIELIQRLSWADADDCNFNRIPDSLDIAEQVADDANGNGVVDECDPDTAIRNLALGDAWRTDAKARAVPFFRVRFAVGLKVDIDYTVPGDSASVRLQLTGVDGRVVHSFVDASVPGGPYSIEWNLFDAQGDHVPPGRYSVILVVNGRRFARYTAWAP